MPRIRNATGFTIIEVLIVLAIAGLIILIVFLAVPALQRNSRNNERRNDISKLAAALAEYKVNNNGNLPDTNVATRAVIMNMANTSTLTDIRINPNNNPVSDSASTKDFAYIRIGENQSGGKCNDAGNDAGGSNPIPKTAAIVYYIETISGYQKICLQAL